MDRNRPSITLKPYHLISYSTVETLNDGKESRFKRSTWATNSYCTLSDWLQLINDQYTQLPLIFINKALMKSSNAAAIHLWRQIWSHDSYSTELVSVSWHTLTHSWMLLRYLPKKKNQTPQMTMSNVKFTHKKTISYQKVISTQNPFSNITAPLPAFTHSLESLHSPAAWRRPNTQKRKEIVDF